MYAITYCIAKVDNKIVLNMGSYMKYLTLNELNNLQDLIKNTIEYYNNSSMDIEKQNKILIENSFECNMKYKVPKSISHDMYI